MFDYPDNSLGDIAMANITGGRPVIWYNPRIVLSVSPSTRRFFYFHECGHHALGQIVSGRIIPYVSEQEADCWAARTLVASGTFSVEDLRAVQADVSRTPGDWTHLPGPRRALNLEACLQQGGGGGGGRPGGRPRPQSCRVVTEWEDRVTYETRYVQQPVPCSHTVCGYYGCGPAHQYDFVNVPQQFPVRHRVPVQRTICN